MRKFLLLCSCAALAASCIDGDYDLSAFGSGPIALGDETSLFKMPLAQISVALGEIHDDKGSLQQMLDEADVWLPSQLPGAADYVDLVRVREDESYLTGLLDALFDEMLVRPAKLDAVADLIWNEYKRDFLGTLGLPGTVSESLFKETFGQLVRTSGAKSAIFEQIGNSAARYLTALDVDDLVYDLGSLDLGDALEMLTDNLDPEGTPDPKNTLSIEGEVSSTLPLALSLMPRFSPAEIEIPTFRVEVGTTKLPSTRIYAEELRTLSEAGSVEARIAVDLLRYYPGRTLDDKSPVAIRLSLHKTGSLKLNL